MAQALHKVEKIQVVILFKSSTTNNFRFNRSYKKIETIVKNFYAG